jgi:hypothetical protein
LGKPFVEGGVSSSWQGIRRLLQDDQHNKEGLFSENQQTYMNWRLECYCTEASFGFNWNHPINHGYFQEASISNSYCHHGKFGCGGDLRDNHECGNDDEYAMTANAAAAMDVATTTNVATMATTNVAMTTHVARSTNVVTMIPLPNPTNDIMFTGLFGLNNKGKKFRRDQAKYLRKENNLLVIQGKNKDLLTLKGDMAIIQTTPERKPAIVFSDDMRPAVNLQDYVPVTPDTSPYKNRPHRYGYITTFSGVEAATIVSMK